ncbi:MAG: hypothetical protein OJF59_000897 [Cytophagales bacterium]|nr:MAG: hypothetical protein OJF59_000897 [Cytophagales bacterium]
MILLPQTEPAAYPQGHFKRVYDYVMVPACRLAGYWPSTWDDLNAQPLDIIKSIVDCEIVICDVSATYTDALYVVAVRQALNLPVVLTKDLKSLISFDAGESALMEYDESLRIDTVQKATEELSKAIQKAVENKQARNAVLNRLAIGLPKLVVTTETPPEPQHNEAIQEIPQETHLPIISPLPDYVAEPYTQEQLLKLKTGSELFHLHHGKGKVNFVKKMGKDTVANIQFGSGSKLLVLEASDLFRKISG